jgi:hypothetical protein
MVGLWNTPILIGMAMIVAGGWLPPTGAGETFRDCRFPTISIFSFCKGLQNGRFGTNRPAGRSGKRSLYKKKMTKMDIVRAFPHPILSSPIWGSPG